MLYYIDNINNVFYVEGFVFYAIYRILKEAHCGAMSLFRCLVAKVLDKPNVLYTHNIKMCMRFYNTIQTRM